MCIRDRITEPSLIDISYVFDASNVGAPPTYFVPDGKFTVMLLPVVNRSQQSKFPVGKVSLSEVTADEKRYSVLSTMVRFTVPPEGVILDTDAAAPMFSGVCV